VIQPTEKQQKILDFIIEFREKRSYSPTLREIGKGSGISSLRGVRCNIDALEAKGYLRTEPHISRGIIPTPSALPRFKDSKFRIITDGMKHRVFFGDVDVSSAILSITVKIEPHEVAKAELTLVADADLVVLPLNVTAYSQIIRGVVSVNDKGVN
jgi:repressor LexA